MILSYRNSVYVYNSVSGQMKFLSIPRVVKQTNYEWYRDTNPLSIEATSYAVLAMLLKGSVTDALPVFRWLNEQRQPYGGFITLHVGIYLFIYLFIYLLFIDEFSN